ncbi:hypothetical protein E2562_014451 [Oryza meyeriana var. granulata]|uniref:RING-type domain-containing protein n=1 Tax=Oryza meyeriana var. granulata TaxID=110450 RepID=A0A6G1CPX6_9ORYZ|nr:hypothetical protein E2562_014451 [Oryza meyeriana var. granulata]
MATPSSSEARKPESRPPPCDFLVHVEAYLSRRDGVDKLLKISRYAARLALAAGPLPPAASAPLKSFESSVGLSRKAFRLGKFVQSVNALRAHPNLAPPIVLLAYGGEGVYYFLEQLVWLAKAGLLPAHLLPLLQRLSAWAELLGYVGSITIKLEEVAKLESSVKMRLKEGCGEDSEVVRTLRGKLLLKRMSVVQDVADAVMALGDVTDGMGKGGEGAVPVGESGGRRRRRLGEDGDDDDDEEYVLEEEEEYEDDLSASSASEGGEGSDEEYEEDDEDEENETPRPRQPVKGHENGREGKADPAVVRFRRRKYEEDDDYLDELEEEEGVDEYDEDLEEEEEQDEAPRTKRTKKCGNRNLKGKVPPERSNRRRYEEDMDFDPDLDEEEEEEDMDFDSEVEEEEEEDFEDEEEDELEASKVRAKNIAPQKSALNQRRGKKKSSCKVSSQKARKAASVRRQQRKRSMIDHYEDDDFIVEDEVTANRQPRKKARLRRQVEVDPPTPVFEAETWPTVDSDTTDFDFVTSDEEAAIPESTRAIKKGRKKRVFVSDSSSDSDFVVSDKESGDLKEPEPPESLKMLPSSPREISITGNGEYKGKAKKEQQEAGRATCGICLSEEQRVTVQGVLDCCSHYFCFACIMQWSKVESRCPLCKRRFTTITKLSKEDTGLELTNPVIRVEERDQVYQPTEEEIRRWLDPYENVVCIECNQEKYLKEIGTVEAVDLVAREIHTIVL